MSRIALGTAIVTHLGGLEEHAVFLAVLDRALPVWTLSIFSIWARGEPGLDQRLSHAAGFLLVAARCVTTAMAVMRPRSGVSREYQNVENTRAAPSRSPRHSKRSISACFSFR